MDNTENSDHEERAIARLLRAAGPREQIPDELKHSWEARFREELQAATAKRKLRRRKVLAAVAASVTVCAIALSLLGRSPGPIAAQILISSISGSNQIVSTAGNVVEALAGMEIASGSTVQTQASGRVAVAYAGYDLRLDAGGRFEFGDARITVHSGQIYVSDKAHRIGNIQLRIITPQGEVRDIGTQFTVQVDAKGTIATVRRGTILVDTHDGEIEANAPTGQAARVTLATSGEVNTKRVPASGEEWRWIYDIAPDFELEGKSVYAFLTWSVGESGHKLEFASASAERYARSIVLHGSSTGLDPERAVNLVLGTTDLGAQVRGDSLLISLQR